VSARVTERERRTDGEDSDKDADIEVN
jgi:hypothetical protein